MINQILYTDPLSEIMARFTQEMLKIEIREYEVPDPNFKKLSGRELSPGTLLLGSNSSHHLATFLTRLPIVVIDLHTEMANDFFPMNCGNWLYWRLRELAPPAHLVMPYSSMRWPADLPNFPRIKRIIRNLKIYGLRIDPCFRPQKLLRRKVEDWQKLKRFPGPLQISLDFDIMKVIPREEIAELLKLLANENNVYDFWFEKNESYNFRSEKNENLKDQQEKFLYLISFL